MDSTLLEQLLYECESSTLDFKRDQYKFAKASEDEKAELLKDILGFVNGWRRSDGFILIGVEEVVGGRSAVYGITEHLLDHSLQQFVNNLTNRPVQFGYEACQIEGKQVGVIRIEQQHRPIYLKKDYGFLKKDEVYVRRGTSTDPNKPARPEEIASMGARANESLPEAEIRVEFADPDREVVIGVEFNNWTACSLELPDFQEIPDLAPAQKYNPLGVNLDALLNPGTSINSKFYREFANYEFFRRLYRRVRLVVTNIGKVAAKDVRIEFVNPTGQGIGISEAAEAPDKPKQKRSVYDSFSQNMKHIRRVIRDPGEVDISQSKDRQKLEIECQNLQPGRRVWSDAFYLGFGESGQYSLNGHVYAANLSEPKSFTLTVNATVSAMSLSVDELCELTDRIEENEED